jgi:DNA primase
MKDDLLQEIELDLGSPLRRSGRWVFWRCPFHADNTPSLGVTADNARWYCFSCSRGGDVRAWTREYRRERIPAPSETQQSICPMVAPEDYSSPPANVWQARAWNFLTDCQATLWRPVAQKARWGLYGRGLNGDTFTPTWIGYHPGDRFEPLDRWGLQPRSEKEKAVYLPAGLVIPWIIEDVVWKINIRRLGQQTPKYLQVKGSRPGLFGAHNLAGKSTVFIVEGEFDALLLQQEAGDLVGVCTFGSAGSRNLHPRWLSYFLACQRIYLVGDNDIAGQAWSEAMAAFSKRMRRVILPAGKDVTEFWLQGGDLRAWLQALILESK